MMIRSYCLMHAGKCEEGRKLQLEFQAYIDKNKERTEEEHEEMTNRYAESKCTVGSLRTLDEKVLRLAHGIGKAKDRRKPDQCEDWAKQAEKLAASLRPGDEGLKDVGYRLALAGMCIGEAGRCDEARSWIEKSLVMQGTPKSSPKFQIIADGWMDDIKACK
jgi:hypothetical protein